MIRSTDHKPWVLLVEDDEATAEALSMLLEYEGFAVRWVKSGHEALEAETEALQHPERHVIVTDLMLPDMTAVDLCREVTELAKDPPPVIVMSAGPARQLEDAGRRAHARSVLRKPVDIEDLVDTLSAI